MFQALAIQHSFKAGVSIPEERIREVVQRSLGILG